MIGSHTYACRCGENTDCTPEELRLGMVFQCPACLEVSAHVYPQDGGRAWITVDPKQVEFYHLLRQYDNEEDE